MIHRMNDINIDICLLLTAVQLQKLRLFFMSSYQMLLASAMPASYPFISCSFARPNA